MKRNPYLRVKLKSLAEEARIIRVEEKRANLARDYELQGCLRWHRIDIVRKASRETLLAYQYLRGIPYSVVEKEGSEEPNWKSVLSMIRRYGNYPLDRTEQPDIDRWVKGKKSKLAA